MTDAQAAAIPANVALRPAGKAQKLAYSVEPGAVLSGAVLVQNNTGRDRAIRIAAVDVGTAALGGAVYGERPGKGTGRWLDLNIPSVRVAAHRARVVRFRIRVPRNAPAGVHYAGITAIDADQLRAVSSAPSGTAKRIVFHRIARFALPVKIRVKGEGVAPRLHFSDATVAVDAAGANVLVKLENTGETLIRRTAVDLQVKQGARTLFAIKQHLKEFVPDSAAQYPMPWPGAPKEGRYRLIGEIRPAGAPVINVDAALKVDGKNATSAGRSLAGRISRPEKARISLMVWLALGLVTTAAAALGLAFVRTRRRLQAATARHDDARR
jgi:hypothetical protein